MAERQYRKLQGMGLEFVSGVLEENSLERAIGYSVTFRMSLDFTHFLVMANLYISDYLDNPANAIRPELAGIAYHQSFNYFSENAGNIHNSPALFKVFTHSDNYIAEWSDGTIQRRAGIPAFEVVDGGLQVISRMDFRRKDKRPILIQDLPTVAFDWMLNLMRGYDSTAPISVVTFGYAGEDYVDVEGEQMLRGQQYMVGRTLDFGVIGKDRILTAGD